MAKISTHFICQLHSKESNGFWDFKKITPFISSIGEFIKHDNVGSHCYTPCGRAARLIVNINLK